MLVLAPLGRDADLACRTLGHAGLQCRQCRDVADLRAQPVEGYAALLLTEEALTADTVHALAALLDAQPSWSDLPVTILTGRNGGGAGRAGTNPVETLGTRRGVVVLERPVRIATFVSIMRSAVLARQRQYELRDQFVARQEAEAHARMLTEEMKHRIKNSLGLVGAVASQTFRHARSVQESLQVFSARLKAMAIAQDVLTQGIGDGAFLHDLISKALEPYQQHDAPDRIAIGGPEVSVGGHGSTLLTMAIHELATNAVKHGALSVDAGRVAIGWQVEPVSGINRLTIEWREHGGPLVTPPTRRGFGSGLVERGLAMELQGKAEIDFRPEGVVCKITASLEALADTSAQ